MNSSESEAVWLSPVSAHEISLHSTDTQKVLEVAVARAILTAAIAGTFTASVDVSTSSSGDVQYVAAHLNQGNYQAQVTGSNLVISW